MKKKFKLGIIGCGFMAKAVIDGILKNNFISPQNIIVSRKNKNFDDVANFSVNTTFDNAYLVDNSEFVLLAVKPQALDEVLDEIKDCRPDVIISILAGIKKQNIKNAFPSVSVARAMPNTPCSLGLGITALDASELQDSDKKFVKSVFSAVGEVVEVDESQMNAVTGISGSGPAYVYLFLKGLIAAGVKNGLNETVARRLAIETFIGGAFMAKNNADKALDDLINAVCSKGGTTIEAIKTFNENGFTDVIGKAVDACVIRAAELGGDVQKPDDAVWIYTDGACSGNPGVGGWGAILMHGDKQKEISGGEDFTTNNRMELMAVICALRSLKKPCKVKLFTDSAYVSDAYSKNWIYSWKNNGWKTSSKSEVKNIDLWEELLRLTALHNVEFNKVKGHADNEYNNRCDQLARGECKKRQKPV